MPLSLQVTRKLVRPLPGSWRQVTSSSCVQCRAVLELVRGPRTERQCLPSHLPKYSCALYTARDRHCCCCIVSPPSPGYLYSCDGMSEGLLLSGIIRGLLTPCCPGPGTVGDPVVLKATHTDTESW